MERDQFRGQHDVEAFDRNLEAQRISEVKEGLAYPVEELAGKEVTLTPEQHGNLHAWDVFMEELFPQMDADHKRMHDIKPWEFRQFNPDHE